MCGLTGIVRFDMPAHTQVAPLRSMIRALKHRGPDGEGEHIGQWVALGHTRLALLDAAHGAQPFYSPEGRYVLVYNGELADHSSLRAQLDWPWRTGSDAETLLAAWVRWGPQALERLNGMFAFFVWDNERHEGFAARDRLGIKPFVFSYENNTFRFASEAKALLHAQTTSPRACMSALIEALATPHFSAGPRTPFEGIHHLQPGAWLRIRREGLSQGQWWRWRAEPHAPAECVSELAHALRQAVSAALQADVPVGLFLSGGLDSTALASLAYSERGWRGPAFSIDYEGRQQFDYSEQGIVLDDDLPFAMQAANEWALAWRRVAVASQTRANDLEALSATNDGLPVWEQEVSQQHLARAAAREVKAVLVGDAADETHYGYRFLLDANVSPEKLMAQLGGFPLRPDFERDAQALPKTQRVLAEDAGHTWESAAARAEAMTFLVVSRWLPRLLHNGDIHTMAAGLEARVPFGDIRVLDVAQRMGAASGLRDGMSKWVLREALKDVVPEALRLRVKSALPKDLAAAPQYQAQALRLLSEPTALVRDVVDLRAMEALAQAPRLTESERSQLFRFVCFSHWARVYDVRSP